MNPESSLYRREYEMESLDRKDLHDDPIEQFRKWYLDAQSAGHRDPSAMTLATVDASGAPHARMVLLKAVDERGFIFCTHRESPKGKDLLANPKAALAIYWPKIERQVRIEGAARWLTNAENAAFFSARPRGAQIAALLGHQSEEVPDRETLDREYKGLEREYESRDIPPPETWGAFAIQPDSIEFWQGGLNRLHDRFIFRRIGDGWTVDRLMP